MNKLDNIKINNNHIWTKCPFCFNENIYKIGNIEYFEPLMFSTKFIEIIETPELWKCRVCKSTFVQNSLTEYDAKNLYETGDSSQRWPNGKLFEFSKSQSIIKYLNKLLLPEKKILDFGCNDGHMLDYFKHKSCKTFGFEYSKDSRKILEQKSHKSYGSLNEIDEKFDIITAFDLVEHLYKPTEFFKNCHKFLDKNGLLIILTGNNSCISSKLTKENWWYVRYPEHVSFASKKYLNNHDGYELINWIPTFAMLQLESTITKGLKSLVSYGKKYNGRPSIGADHVLIVMRKKNGV